MCGTHSAWENRSVTLKSSLGQDLKGPCGDPSELEVCCHFMGDCWPDGIVLFLRLPFPTLLFLLFPLPVMRHWTLGGRAVH